MSQPHRATNSPSEDDRFAAELERLDQSLSSGSGLRPTPHSEGGESEISQRDPQLDGAADVLQMMRRVRQFEEQSLGSDVAPIAPDTRSESGRTETPHSQSSTADLLPGMPTIPEMIGRFRMIRLLGSGGFGLVFLAIDTKLDRRVAIKVPRPEVLATASNSDRFLREGRAAAALNHPNIVPVYEVGEFGGVAYIASAYCDGSNLAEWLQQRSRLVSPHAAAALVARLADAAEHAHRRGILHRDLKPANILLEFVQQDDSPDAVDSEASATAASTPDIVTAVDGPPLSQFDLAAQSRINDFGLAKFSDAGLATQTTGTLGTPSYMPPEQADPNAGKLGPQADVYSLGAILYELLTGRPPFQEATILTTLDAVRGSPPKPPHKIVSGVPADLEAITLKCLEKKPDHRYDSAAALADDLERFLNHQPVRARRIHSGERFLRWCRKNPVVASLVAAVVLLAIGSTITSVRLAISRGETRAALSAAVTANRQAIQSEYAAQVALATSVQRSSAAGQRVESLNALRRASQLGRQLGIDAQQQLRLRNAVITGLSKSDLVLQKRWPVNVVGESFLATDPDCQLYAHADDQRSHLLLRRIEDNAVHSRLKLKPELTRLIGMRFSPDGSRLGARYVATRGRERLQLWDLTAGHEIADLEVGGFGQAAGFSVDGSRIALIAPGSRAIEIRQLPAFSLEKKIDVATPVQTLALAPSGNTLAVYRDGSIALYDWKSGRRKQTLQCPSYAYVLEFSPDARRLVAACRDTRIRLYDLTDQDADGPRPPNDILEGHTAMVVKACWHPSEPLLASCSMDGKSRLWDLKSSRTLLQLDHKCTSFSRDGNWLGIEGGRMRVELSRSHRSLRQSDSKIITPIDLGFYPRGDVTSEIDFWVTLPGSRLVVGQNYFRAVFRDPTSDTALADVAVPGCWFRFDSQGQWLYASSQLVGFCRLPIKQHETDDHIVVEIGPPEVVHPARGGAFAIARDRIVLTPFLSQGYILPVKQTTTWQSTSRLDVHPYTFWCDLSPDGRLAATGAMKSRDVRIFDANSGSQLRTLTSETAAPWFSPDGRMLVVAENARFTFFDTETWQQTHQIETVAGGIWPGSLAFSDDSKMLALEMGSKIRLIATDEFSPIATFEVPPNELIESIRFSGDGRFLVSGGGDQHLTHVWDLAAIRSSLREFVLDWDPTESLAVDQPLKPIRLRLDLGEIANTDKRPVFAP
jgi:serine/threonine protein kinase/WD40 repeat protein